MFSDKCFLGNQNSSDLSLHWSVISLHFPAVKVAAPKAAELPLDCTPYLSCPTNCLSPELECKKPRRRRRRRRFVNVRRGCGDGHHVWLVGVSERLFQTFSGPNCCHTTKLTFLFPSLISFLNVFLFLFICSHISRTDLHLLCFHVCLFRTATTGRTPPTPHPHQPNVILLLTMGEIIAAGSFSACVSAVAPAEPGDRR